MKYEALFQKGQIGPMRLKNRIVMPAMTMGFAGLNGEVTETLIRHYEERAKGGVGLIVTEIFKVNEEHGNAFPRQVSVATPLQHMKLREMVTRVKQYGTKIVAQLHHGGNTNMPELNGGVIYSASDVPTITQIVPTPFTTEQVEELVQAFIRGAKICQDAGFDGVEVHGAHGYLLGQFMSEYYNKRTDKYGGSFENRMRFTTEIIEGIRKTCGDQFAVLVRISAEEYLSGFQEGTITLEEGVKIAQAMEAAGAHAIDVSVCNYFSSQTAIEPYSYPAGWRKNVTQAVKDAVSVPVIGTNTIKDPAFANQLLVDGVSDFVAVGRGHLVDPEWVKKTYEGREDEIRKCIGCLYCFESLTTYGTARCTVNSKLGLYSAFDHVRKVKDEKKIAVVGGGPAGMQAASVLGKRGYKVTLYEKDSVLGGTLNVADKVDDYKFLITDLSKTLQREVELAGVKVKLNTEATPELLKDKGFKNVILAIGGTPYVPNIPGIDRENVYLANDILTGIAKAQGKTVVIGSGLTGLEVAEKLSHDGFETSIVEMMDSIGPGIYPIMLMDITNRLNAKNVQYFPGHKFVSFDGSKVEVEKLATGEKVSLDADTVVLAMGVATKCEEIKPFDEAFERVDVIGDAGKYGNVYDALMCGLVVASNY